MCVMGMFLTSCVCLSVSSKVDYRDSRVNTAIDQLCVIPDGVVDLVDQKELDC